MTWRYRIRENRMHSPSMRPNRKNSKRRWRCRKSSWWVVALLIAHHGETRAADAPELQELEYCDADDAVVTGLRQNNSCSGGEKVYAGTVDGFEHEHHRSEENREGNQQRQGEGNGQVDHITTGEACHETDNRFQPQVSPIR